jgi:hypothetical protein
LPLRTVKHRTGQRLTTAPFPDYLLNTVSAEDFMPMFAVQPPRRARETRVGQRRTMVIGSQESNA